jgi:type IV pilus assembly protein PilA
MLRKQKIFLSKRQGFTLYGFLYRMQYGHDSAADVTSSRERSMKTVFSRNRSGFTLIEILLVIGIIAVLATVVIVALDPAKRFSDAKDARRLSDIQSILSATQQYIVDNKGTLPSGLDSSERQIGTAPSGCSIAGNCGVTVDACVDLSGVLSLGHYLKSLPYDPSQTSDSTTHYSIQVDSNGIVTVTSCDAIDTTIASVSR